MDIYYLFIWWLFFLVVGLINFPLTWFLFRKSFDLGYGFSKTIGLLIVSYLAFIGASAKVLPLSQAILFVILLLTGVLGAFLAFKNESFLLTLKKSWKIILLQEIIFTLGLVLWTIVRSYAPDTNRASMDSRNLWISDLSIRYFRVNTSHPRTCGSRVKS